MRHIFRSKLNRQNYKSYGTVRILTALVFLYFTGLGIYQLYFSEDGQEPRIKATVLIVSLASISGATLLVQTMKRMRTVNKDSNTVL